jgi:hypothetical protein
MTSCPSLDELEELLAGLLGERYHAVLGHVTACVLCQSRVDGLEEPCDEFVRAVREAAKGLRAAYDAGRSISS